jgi:hypothetical protein
MEDRNYKEIYEDFKKLKEFWDEKMEAIVTFLPNSHDKFVNHPYFKELQKLQYSDEIKSCEAKTFIKDYCDKVIEKASNNNVFYKFLRNSGYTIATPSTKLNLDNIVMLAESVAKDAHKGNEKKLDYLLDEIGDDACDPRAFLDLPDTGIKVGSLENNNSTLPNCSDKGEKRLI